MMHHLTGEKKPCPSTSYYLAQRRIRIMMRTAKINLVCVTPKPENIACMQARPFSRLPRLRCRRLDTNRQPPLRSKCVPHQPIDLHPPNCKEVCFPFRHVPISVSSPFIAEKILQQKENRAKAIKSLTHLNRPPIHLPSYRATHVPPAQKPRTYLEPNQWQTHGKSCPFLLPVSAFPSAFALRIRLHKNDPSPALSPGRGTCPAGRGSRAAQLGLDLSKLTS